MAKTRQLKGRALYNALDEGKIEPTDPQAVSEINRAAIGIFEPPWESLDANGWRRSRAMSTYVKALQDRGVEPDLPPETGIRPMFRKR